MPRPAGMMEAPGSQPPLPLPEAVWARRKAIWPRWVVLILAGWATSTSLNCAAGPKDEACCSLAASRSHTLQELQNKNKQLRAQLSRCRWPNLKSFSANGQIYYLPLRAHTQDWSHMPTESRLAYLAGFFDGDGCVFCATNLSGAGLGVSQSFDQAEILMIFRATFGGSITREHGGMGLRKPALRWCVWGQAARRAALLLAPHSITKQQQLVLAAQWPDAKSLQREKFKAKLGALKKYDSAVAGPCSWEYFAGFFDAEGYIEQPHGGNALVLKIAQKHPQVLRCIRSFLARSLGINASCKARRLSAFTLGLQHTE